MTIEQLQLSSNGKKTIRAAVFGGQGTPLTENDTSFVKRFSTASNIFSEASDVLGFSLEKLLPQDRNPLTHETSIMQPLVVVLEYAKFRVNVEEKEVDFDFFAGHSLGEVTALLASEMIDFSDALRFAKVRGELMKKAGEECDGGIIAVRKLKQADVFQIAKDTKNYVSNMNAEDQTCISGLVVNLKEAEELIKEASGKSVRLLIEFAPHCALMESAEKGIKEYLKENIIFRDSKNPVYLNATGDKTTSGEEARVNQADQVVLPVDWLCASSTLIDTDLVDEFWEFSPGNGVLNGLTSRYSTEVIFQNGNSVLSKEFAAV